MGILSNFIGGAAQAGGEILQRERESGVRVKESQDIARFNDDLATKREQTLAALRNQYQIDAEGRGEERTIAGEQRGLTNRASERQAIVDETVANAPKLRDVKVEDAKAVKRAEYDPEIQALMRKAETEKLTASEQAKLDFYTQNRKAIIGQTRDEAEARRDRSGDGLRALQMESARIKLDMEKAESKLPPAVKGSIASIQKQADAISAAITKAELDGSASPEAVQKYQTRLSELNGQITKLYEPYLSERDRASLAPKAPAAVANAWDDATGDVIANGKVIGKAKTAAEAKAMIAAGARSVPQPPPKGAPAPSGPPVDRLRDQPIGILTPMATIKEAAAAGNKQAQAYLDRRAQGQADTESAPRTAAEMLNR